MAYKVFTAYNFQKNEIQNVAMQSLADHPANPVAGQFYFNSVLQTPYLFSGAKWIDLGVFVAGNGIQITGDTVSVKLNTTALAATADGLAVVFGTGAGTVCQGNDPRLHMAGSDNQNLFSQITGDSGTPIVATTQTDVVDIGGSNGIATTTDGGSKSISIAPVYGNGAGTVCEGNDARLHVPGSDNQDVFTTVKSGNDNINIVASTETDTITIKGKEGIASTGDSVGKAIELAPVYGSLAGTVCEGNDPRLHTHLDQDLNLGTGDLNATEGNFQGNVYVGGNLTVAGETTVVNSTTVNIGDAEIVLNADNNTAGGNATGGMAVKRLAADNVSRIDAKVEFDEATDQWYVVVGALKHAITRKYTTVFGNGTDNTYTITHNMGTRDVQVQVMENGNNYETIGCEMRRPDVNTVQLVFGSAISQDSMRVVIQG